MRISCPGVLTTIGPLSSEDMNGRGVSSFFAISTEQLLGLRESAVSFGNLKQKTNTIAPFINVYTLQNHEFV